ncbi:MAG: hypothetical protein ABUT20_31890 [Bacteroidota bacterium]
MKLNLPAVLTGFIYLGIVSCNLGDSQQQPKHISKAKPSLNEINDDLANGLKSYSLQADPAIRYYVIIPGTGCGGCISGVESFLKDNYTKFDNTRFILTKIQSKKMLKIKLGIDITDRHLIIDSSDFFSQKSLYTIYPAFYFMDSTQKVSKFSYASPEENGLEKLTAELGK